MTYEYEVWQGDEMVASVSADDRRSALQEIAHYAAVYSQDGECVVTRVVRVPVNLERELTSPEYKWQAHGLKADGSIGPMTDEEYAAATNRDLP